MPQSIVQFWNITGKFSIIFMKKIKLSDTYGMKRVF